MTTWSSCPDTGCGLLAEVLDDWTDPTCGTRHVKTRCANRHVLTTHNGRADFVPPMPHEPECSACTHAVHLLRCEVLLDAGVPCPCRRIPIPGVYP